MTFRRPRNRDKDRIPVWPNLVRWRGKMHCAGANGRRWLGYWTQSCAPSSQSFPCIEYRQQAIKVHYNVRLRQYRSKKTHQGKGRETHICSERNKNPWTRIGGARWRTKGIVNDQDQHPAVYDRLRRLTVTKHAVAHILSSWKRHKRRVVNRMGTSVIRSR